VVPSRQRLIRSSARVLAPLVALVLIAVVFVPLVPSYDVGVFLRAGRAALHGGAIYPHVGSPAVYSGFSFVYPYFAVWPFVPLAVLPTPVAIDLFFAVEAAAVVAVSLLAARNDPTYVLIVLCTAFMITGFQLGSLSPLLFVGVVLMWHLRERPIVFGLVAAPVVASKLFLAPLLLWPLLAGRYRAFAWSAASTAVLLAAGFALGPVSATDYAQILSQLGVHEAPAGLGLISALRDAGIAQAAAEALALGLATAMLAVAYLRFRRSRDERVLLCAGVIASLIVTPVLWGHYFVLLVAMLLVIGAPRRWLVALALSSWLIAPPHGLQLRHLTEPIIGRVSGHGPWLAAIASLVVFGYATWLTLKRSSPTTKIEQRAGAS
jgi:hypothetical protein